MADERDPCQRYPDVVVVELEDEEVPPEFQNVPFPNMPGFPGVPSVAESVLQFQEDEPEVTVFTSPDPAEVFTDTINRMGGFNNNEFLASLQANAQATIAEDRQNLLNENLEDAVLTPRYQNYLAAGRSTWLFNNNASAYSGRLGELFTSKPKHILAIQAAPLTSIRAPSNVYDATYTADSFRWFADKLWVNASDLSGPQEYTSPDTMKIEHGKTKGSSDFYFINKASGGAIHWGILYIDPGKNATIRAADPGRLGSVFARDKWENLEEIVDTLSEQNFLDLKIGYEVHELYAVSYGPDSQQWSWVDYFAGNVKTNHAAEYVRPGPRTPSGEIIRNFRALASRPQSPTSWNIILFSASPELRKVNLNPFPVIPFYGEKFPREFNTHPLNPTGPGRMPHVGRNFYEDIVTNVVDVLSKEEADVLDIGNKSYFDIRPVYSYYDCMYEKIFSDVLDEIELPSPYIRVSELSYETSSRRKEGLSSPIKEDFIESLSNKLQVADSFYQMNYFSENSNPIMGTYARSQNDFVSTLRGAAERNEDSERALAVYMSDYYGFNIDNEKNNLYLSSYTREELDMFYDRRFMNPMFVEMELGSVQKSQLSEAMTLNGDDTLMKNLFSNLRTDRTNINPDVAVEGILLEPDQESQYTDNQVAMNEDLDERLDMDGVSYVDQIVQSGFDAIQGEETLGVELSTGDTRSLTPYRSFDFARWFDQQFKFYTGQMASQMSPMEKFSNIFRMLLIKIRISRFINSRSRTYSQIMSGVPAKNEVIGFSIDKYLINRVDNSRTYISTFHIMSNNDREVEKFVDTQVKYSRVYDYEINRVVAIVGNRYAYVDINSKFDNYEDNDFRKGVGIVNMPFLNIAVVPSTVRRVSVTDKPPVFPNVDFVPYKGVKNQVLINLSAATGEYSARPVTLLQTDNQHFYATCISQNLITPGTEINLDANFSLQNVLSPGSLLKHRHDDAVVGFETFRVEEHPGSYDDFYNSLRSRRLGYTDNVSILDRIVPNKKYYYIFRTIDIHGHRSNPSEVYMIEMVTINDATRLKVEIVPFKSDPIEPALDGKQFIYLIPALAQRTLNTPPTGKFSDLERMNTEDVLGDENLDKVWNKRFKLRLRSKNTGKEIDINFRFNLKVHKHEENKKVNLIC
tara:strand:- start:34652 stop:38074 length:3423 start_codon:yes stop_codon:yes gene_type:complete